MRAVGIREIKSRFSEYVRMAAGGETVLVTDRGRVVAQLAPPPTHGAPARTEGEALRRLSAAGKVRLPSPAASFSGGTGALPGLPGGLDIGRILEEVRSDTVERSEADERGDRTEARPDTAERSRVDDRSDPDARRTDPGGPRSRPGEP